MQKYNACVISCPDAIHLQQALNNLWKCIDWMCIAVKAHSVWIQTMRINSLWMHITVIVGIYVSYFQKFLKGIPKEYLALCWLWLVQYILYIYVWWNFSTYSHIVKKLSYKRKIASSGPDHVRMLWYPKSAIVLAYIMLHRTLKIWLSSYFYMFSTHSYGMLQVCI